MEKNEELAERIKLLFGFCALLIPYKEKLKKVLEYSENASSRALELAPVIIAFGEDYEAIHFDAELYQKRARALYEFIRVLDEAEKERIEKANGKIRANAWMALINKKYRGK